MFHNVVIIYSRYNGNIACSFNSCNESKNSIEQRTYIVSNKKKKRISHRVYGIVPTINNHNPTQTRPTHE